MSAKCRKAALETASNGIKLPFSVMTVQLAYYHCRFNREIFAKVVTDKLAACRRIHNPDKRVADLSEILPPQLRIINRYRKLITNTFLPSSAELHGLILL